MARSNALDELVDLDALGPSGAYRALTREQVADVAGSPVAELSLVPTLYVHRAVAGLRRAAPLPAEERRTALAHAADLFLAGEFGGLSLEDYQRTVSRVSGLAISVVRESTTRIVAACRGAFAEAFAAMPPTTVSSFDDPRAKRGVGLWVRRGEVFGVHAAGNHPAVHANWLLALALGYRVAVRPSRREPFTPHRLVSALRAAGFGDDGVAFLPTDHAAADELLRSADRSMVYGGEEVIRKYGGDPAVLPQGPGRSKILITDGVDWRRHLDVIVASIARNGGVSCTNTTAIFVERDAADLARELANRLKALPSRFPLDDDALLPVQPVERARAIEAQLGLIARGTEALMGGSGVVDELGDGSAVLRPAVHLLPDPLATQAGVEMPFPCVWVSPWDRAAGVAPLRNTLALAAFTDDLALVEELLSEPSVRSVYLGARPTTWSAPCVPHDGYLTDFLMDSKGVIRD